MNLTLLLLFILLHSTIGASEAIVRTSKKKGSMRNGRPKADGKKKAKRKHHSSKVSSASSHELNATTKIEPCSNINHYFSASECPTKIVSISYPKRLYIYIVARFSHTHMTLHICKYSFDLVRPRRLER